MGLKIKGLAELRQRLAAVRPAEIMEQALAEQAQQLAETVRGRLSDPAGAGPHDTPWVQTGALRDSIEATTSGLEAAVGSNDPAAAPQEMGTSRIPPRPFLAPAAAETGGAIAKAIGQRMAASLRGGGDDQPADGAATPSAATATPEVRVAQRRTYAAPTKSR